jgi:hypothetical protein
VAFENVTIKGGAAGGVYISSGASVWLRDGDQVAGKSKDNSDGYGVCLAADGDGKLTLTGTAEVTRGELDENKIVPSAPQKEDFMKNGDTLPLVRSRSDIQQNIVTLGGYLDETDSPESEYTKKLIGKGHCFVIVSSQNGYRFYPSRFIGYIGNSMEAHEKNG